MTDENWIELYESGSIDAHNALMDDAESEPYDVEPTQRIECAEHGDQRVTDTQTFTGFAGGRCYVWTLACGHAIADESDDLRAAQ